MMELLQSHYAPRLMLGLVLTASAAIAPAADYTPTFYGRFHLTVDNVDHEGALQFIKGDTPVTPEDDWELNSHTSRLGVKGDIGLDFESLKVIYQAEYEIHVDDGDNGSGDTFSQRNIFAGLNHDTYGRVFAGRFDTPFKKAEGNVDQFGDVVDIDNLIGGQNRMDNSIQYSTPAMADMVTVNMAIIQPEGDADVDGDGVNDTHIDDTVSSSVVLEYDWLYAALAYETNQKARRSVDGITAGSDRVDAARLVLQANVAGFEGGILLQQSRDVAPNSDLRDDSVLVSTAYTIDRFKIKAQYATSKGKVTDEKGTSATAGVDYRLGKKAWVYTYVTELKLDQQDLKDKTWGIGGLYKF